MTYSLDRYSSRSYEHLELSRRSKLLTETKKKLVPLTAFNQCTEHGFIIIFFRLTWFQYIQ